MSLSSQIPLTRLRGTNPTHNEIQEVDELFHSFNPSVTFDPSEAISGPRWKQDLHALLEQPTSSTSAFVMHVFITALIIVSALVTVLETVPTFRKISNAVWFGFETTLVALFTMEYIGRTLAWSGSWRLYFRWVTSFYGIIDLLAILPYYIEIALAQDTASFFRFSILRTFRLLRVFRPFRYNNSILLTIEVMFLSFRRSQHALLALSFFVVMVLVVFSTLLYFIERGTWDPSIEIFLDSNGEPSQFTSIPAAAWFVLVTITTVGYGDITPRSFLGQIITIPLLVFGLLLIALPTFVLGREFSLVWDIMSRAQSERGENVFEATDGVDEETTRVSQDSVYMRPNLTRRNTSTELTKQLSELQRTVIAQGELLKRLLDELEGTSRPNSSASARQNDIGMALDVNRS